MPTYVMPMRGKLLVFMAAKIEKSAPTTRVDFPQRSWFDNYFPLRNDVIQEVFTLVDLIDD